MGRENCEKYPKNKRNLLLFGGEIQNLGGEISPPKGPEKNTVCSDIKHLHFLCYWSAVTLNTCTSCVTGLQ